MKTDDAQALYDALDYLMLSKGRAKLDNETKVVWYDILKNYEIADIREGVRHLSRARAPWPDAALVLDYAHESKMERADTAQKAHTNNLISDSSEGSEPVSPERAAELMATAGRKLRLAPGGWPKVGA